MPIACVIVVEELMPRFYFHLTSKDAHIPDDAGKELGNLSDAYEHAWTLMRKHGRLLFQTNNMMAR
jgi:Domain of unknown function (DUF6894)